MSDDLSTENPEVSSKTPEQLAHEILAGLDTLIQQGPWDKSLFLTVTGNRLKEVRRQFLEDLGMKDVSENIVTNASQDNSVMPPEGFQDVYIELYSMNGSDISKWIPILQSIDRYGASRPVYLKSDEANQVLRAKENKQNSAMVVMRVASSQVSSTTAPNSNITKVSVRDNALLTNAIHEFIHVSGNYIWRDNQLVRIGDAAFHA